jgi:hypothetical protein
MELFLHDAINNCRRARGAKVKVLFQRLHMTHFIFAFVYNLKFCILDAPFNTTF